MRRIFILVPSPHPTGPVKGAYALANALAAERSVTLVTLKGGPGVGAGLDPRVARRSLADVAGGWRARLDAYRRLLQAAGGRRRVASISMCLSADIVNCLSGRDAVTCASVRGNLVTNYRLDYGLAGPPVAIVHLVALRRADHVVALTAAMAAQIALYARKTPTVIGNFVDEASLDAYRSSAPDTGPLRFAFLATLSERKQPLLVVRAVYELRRRGVDAVLDMIGCGPLDSAVAAEISRLRLNDSVTLHGHLNNPYNLIAAADAMVLPSLSEGMARSALEALHLGVPCVLRDVDGNAELICDPTRGSLLRDNDALPDLMWTVAKRARDLTQPRTSLLPLSFRQKEQAHLYLALVEREPQR